MSDIEYLDVYRIYIIDVSVYICSVLYLILIYIIIILYLNNIL